MEKFEYTFGPLKMDFHTYLNDPDGWRIDDLKVEYNAKKNRMPDDLANYKEGLIEEKRLEAEKAGKMFFDGDKVRLQNYGQYPIENSDKTIGLYLEFGPTKFFDHVATGQSLDKKVLKDKNGDPTSIREKYITDPYSLDDVLANPTGVNATIVSKPDNAVLYVKRSDKIMQYPGRYGAASAGFMETGDLKDGSPNPFVTIQREAEEEMGVKSDHSDFTITGVGRPWDDMHGEIWGTMELDMTVEKIKSAPKKHKYEFLKILDAQLEPKKVMPILKDAGSTWVNGAAVSMIDTLLKNYDSDTVLNAAYEIL